MHRRPRSTLVANNIVINVQNAIQSSHAAAYPIIFVS
jgi:hypothetical protein